jgi:adenylate cyclase
MLTLGLAVTVASLTPALNEQLLVEGEREVHRLHLRERGRGASCFVLPIIEICLTSRSERLLADTERPADIV